MSSLLLCLVGLAVLAVGSSVAIFCVPRSDPGAETPSASASVDQDARRPDEGVPDSAPPVTPSPLLSEGAEGAGEPKAAWEGGAAGPATLRPDRDVVAVKPRSSKVGDPKRRGAKADRWGLDSFSAMGRVFLLDGVDRSATRRRYFAAPPDQRYAIISGSLTWEGAQPRQIEFEISPQGPPTIQLRSDGQTYDPIGRLVTRLDPLAPLTTAPINVGGEETVALAVAYLVPNETQAVSLLLEGEERVTLNLPPPAQIRVDDLPGVWRKVVGQLRSLRHGDPLINAVANPACRLLRIVRDKRGLSQLTIPSALVKGTEFNHRVGVGAIQLKLARGEHRQPGWIRVIDNGACLVLYTGDDPGAVFLFERTSG